MAKRILHVSLHPERKAPDEDALFKIVDRAPDWVEYAPFRWLLWTSASSATWYSRFREVIGGKDTILIFPADFAEYEGYLPTSVWEWLRKHRPTSRSEASQTTEAEGLLRGLRETFGDARSASPGALP